MLDSLGFIKHTKMRKSIILVFLGIVLGILSTIGYNNVNSKYEYYKWLEEQHSWHIDYIEAIECGDSVKLDSLRQCF